MREVVSAVFGAWHEALSAKFARDAEEKHASELNPHSLATLVIAAYSGAMGAVPESQIQQFIDRIAGPAGADEAAEIEAVLAEAAELLAAGNIDEAAQLYGAVMWFHRPCKLDDWLLYTQDSPSASGARGLTRGSLFTRSGELIASVAQEGLIRKKANE